MYKKIQFCFKKYSIMFFSMILALSFLTVISVVVEARSLMENCQTTGISGPNVRATVVTKSEVLTDGVSQVLGLPSWTCTTNKGVISNRSFSVNSDRKGFDFAYDVTWMGVTDHYTVKHRYFR